MSEFITLHPVFSAFALAFTYRILYDGVLAFAKAFEKRSK